MKHTRRRLFYDIETSFCEGSFWRPGYNQTIHPNQILRQGQIICISWKWEHEDEIHHLDWGIKKQCDKQLIKKFIQQLDKADEIIAHNGDKFDIRWLRARAAYHNLTMKPAYRSIDTYKLVKRYFQLPSYRLGEVAKYFGLKAKKDPGGLETWVDIIINKNQEALNIMIDYCDGDIATLEAIYVKIRRYIKHNLHYAVKDGDDKFMCPECKMLPKWNKTYTTAAGTIKHYMLCRNALCGQYFDINNKTYQDYLKYKVLHLVN